MDPVWGGMFYASFGRRDQVVRELRLESQAAALQLFADAFQTTGDVRFARGLDGIHRYLTGMMASPRGIFYANQKDVVAGLSSGMSVDDYYELDDEGRRATSIPPSARPRS